MKSLKKQRRIQIIAMAVLALTLATGLVIWGLGDGVNYFRTPTQVVAKPPPADEVFRIGGLVETGTLKRGPGTTATFAVTDSNQSVPVTYTGVLPDLFGEGQGMVGTGSLVGGTFVATEILAKHDETYMPREVIDALKEQGVYQPANGS